MRKRALPRFAWRGGVAGHLLLQWSARPGQIRRSDHISGRLNLNRGPYTLDMGGGQKIRPSVGAGLIDMDMIRRNSNYIGFCNQANENGESVSAIGRERYFRAELTVDFVNIWKAFSQTSVSSDFMIP